MNTYALDEYTLEALGERGIFLNPRWFEGHRTDSIATAYGLINLSVNPAVPDGAIVVGDASTIRAFNARRAAREE